MSKHTPGPWAQHPAHPWIIKQDLSPIAEVGDGVTICNTVAHENSGFFPGSEEGRANARLIAAAPELLEALEGLMYECGFGRYLVDTTASTKARAVIALATGNSPEGKV